MKIAQVAPLIESVPPKKYGGTERIVSYLTEELVRCGHDVTLFASGDSITTAKLVPAIPKNIRENLNPEAWVGYHTIQMDMVSELADRFDVIHFHTDYLHFPIARLCRVPYLTTMHGRLDLPELTWIFKRFADTPLVSISASQRVPLPWANFVNTVYHGLPPDLYSYGPGDGGYFLFLGRISPEKRPDRAISIARQCGVPLYIAAKVDRADQGYFNHVIKPLLDCPLVTYLGEVGDGEKQALLQKARALLFPIDWPEPFGLVLIEALACGTPVVAYRRGSTPEVLEHGITGFLVSDENEAIEAARNIHLIDRKQCRESFERRFTVSQMASGYLQAYRQVMVMHDCRRDLFPIAPRRAKLNEGTSRISTGGL
ncbi:glycosyltransferase family 4 protein [Noviherbaspirillum sp. Root189]|uniref:glycosyltransferase family 4 protein n=1 Tax=Noviherbaspirillum sp. Root189 TaxID=1736487 RepID=UPI00070F81B5|nr:glycosyltransferase family 4 protein [Noviherbaspirillum sp. Root189]KRB84851.1 glycosyl transferase [Noviherbaspirillum sp. Root189]